METSYRRRVGVPARGPARDGDPGRDGELPMEEEEEEEEEEEGGGFLARFGAPVVRTPRACRRGEPRLVPWGMHRGFRHGMPRAMSGVRSRRRVLLHAACEAKCCSTRRDRSGHGLLTTGKYRGQGDESSSARVVLKVLPRKEFGFAGERWAFPPFFVGGPRLAASDLGAVGGHPIRYEPFGSVLGRHEDFSRARGVRPRGCVPPTPPRHRRIACRTRTREARKT